MGGTKKKTLASMEKSQDDNANSAAGGGDDKGKTKKTEKTKVVGERKRVDVLLPRMNDQELMKSLASMKAITIYGAARSLSVNAAVAKTVLSSLESKGLVKRVGGFSGHYIWTPASRAATPDISTTSPAAAF
jgi:small subunit ribosomal protein S25e